jgi:sugar (pentulose or hexulose) kinase
LTCKNVFTLEASEAVCQGAAILAGIAAGIYKNAEDATSKVVKIAEAFVPNTAIFEKYYSQLQRYKKIYHSLEEVRSII